jgi:hypothetical protein
MIAFPDPWFSDPARALPISTDSTGPDGRTTRFTLDGDDPLEAHLTATCQLILDGLRGLIPERRLEAVLLGGGYGRGEGGVLHTEKGDRPYNDLEFYVCLRGNRHLNEHRHRLALEVLGEILTPRAGVEIEFKITSLAALRRAPVSMFTYDLTLGHRLLLGDPALVEDLDHHRDAAAIPPAETTRLLMNRCAGLLFAQERLRRAEFTAHDADFVQRNVAKAELAFGDAVLTNYGGYHWSCPERHRRLQLLKPDGWLPWLDDVRRHHVNGVLFKLRPERSQASRSTLQALHAAIVSLGLKVWLWHEQRRLGHTFGSALDYALSPHDKCPEAHPARNLLVNLKHDGPAALLRRDCCRHPRSDALSALSLLLWEPQRISTADTFSQHVAAYKARWQRVN